DGQLLRGESTLPSQTGEDPRRRNIWCIVANADNIVCTVQEACIPRRTSDNVPEPDRGTVERHIHSALHAKMAPNYHVALTDERLMSGSSFQALIIECFTQ
ncbi:unnamed protein product, partial [Ectocarpus sp. 13 AM-2016]